MFTKLKALLFLLAAISVGAQPAPPQNTTYGYVNSGGPVTPPSVHWAPTTNMLDQVNNNSPNCFVNCAPSINAAAVYPFPGEAEVRFVASAKRVSNVLTVTVAVGQGSTPVSDYDGVYNFDKTDHVTLASCGGLNTTSPIQLTNVIHGVKGTPAGSVTAAWTGSDVAATPCVIIRANPVSEDTYLFPSNMSNFPNDGQDIGDYFFGVGKADTMPIALHYEPWFSCPTAASGKPCKYGALPNQTIFGRHIMIGYDSLDAKVIHSQAIWLGTLRKPTAKVGMYLDWQGAPNASDSAADKHDKAVMPAWRDELAGQSRIFMSYGLDNSGFGACNGYSGTPTCIEQVLENSLIYSKTATNATYTNPLDSTSGHAGGGLFGSSAFLHDAKTGQPIIGTFINNESSFFGSCTTAAPCKVYNAGVSGTTCNSPSNCWLAIKKGMANLISGWSTNVRPEFFWRNTTNDNPSINAGEYVWMQVTSNMANQSFPDSNIIAAKKSGKGYAAGVIGRVDHAQDSFASDARGVGDKCGQNIIDWAFRSALAGTGGLYGPSNLPDWAQFITNSDYEEGTALEVGVNNCYGINASLSGDVLSYTLSTTNNTYAPLPLNTATNATLDHVALLIQKQGGPTVGINDTMILDTKAPSQSGTFKMSSYALDSGTYNVCVKLVPKALQHTANACGMTYGGTTPPPPTNTRYVASAGSDSNDGKTLATAWHTIEHADSLAQPGWLILVNDMAGYVGSGGYLQTNSVGTATQHIIFRSLNKWGASITGNAADVWVPNGAYEDIEGFDVTTTSTGATTRQLFQIGASHVGLYGNRVHNMPVTGTCGPLASGAGIHVGSTSSNDTIAGNLVYNIGMAPTAGCNQTHGIYVSTSNNTLYNNIVYNCGDLGIHVYGNGPSYNIVVYNTLVGNGDGVLVGSQNSTAAQGNIVSFNILANNVDNGGYESGTVGPNTYDRNNNFGNNAQWGLLGSNVATNTISGDPLFVSYSTQDFHITSSSPDVGAGLSTNAPAIDFQGGARPQGTKYDVGAYEFGSTPATWPWF